ncbi:MAG: iron-siderophore ABC transporter substrate-binding protein [Dehalococcoidia bacterium]
MTLLPEESSSLRAARAVTRRRFIAGLGSAALAAAFLAACSEDGESDAPTSTATGGAAGATTATATGAASATPGATEAGSAFPVTIEHKFGSVTIEAEPRRVMTLGFSEQDPVLALGVIPVAVREWFGAQPYATWPWAQDELGDGTPEVMTLTYGELEFEQIAALDPDLIIATHSGITDVEYATLARIAPTLAQPAEYPDFGVPWQEQTRLIARALGREERAEEVIAGVESAIAEAAAAHPEFQGATVAWVSPADGDGQFWAVGPNTPPLRFLSALGFTMSEELAAVIGEADSAQISSEQLALLDGDVLIVQSLTPEGRDAIEGSPLFQQLDLAGEGRAIFFESTSIPGYAALSFSTALSLPFALDQLVPLLVAALDGDPATSTETAA